MMADNVPITAGSGTTISTEEVTTLNGGSVSAQHVQRIVNAARTADGTAVDIGHAEDAAHTSGDAGIMMLAVRKDTAAALAGADADYIPLITDANGRLHTVLAISEAPSWTNIAANNTDGVASMDVSNYRSGSLHLTGSFNATISIQFSNDGGSNWLSGRVRNVNTGLVTTSIVLNVSSSSNIFSFDIPNASRMRIRTTSYTSGTVVGSVVLSSLPPSTLDVGAGIVVASAGNDGQLAHSLPDSNGNNRPILVSEMLSNGSTWDRARNANALTVLSSAARTITTNSSDQTNYNWPRFLIQVNVSSIGTGSITPSIQVKDSISGNYATIWTAAAAITTGVQAVYGFGQGLDTASLTEVKSILLSRTWRLVMTANNANSVTYSVSADMIP